MADSPSAGNEDPAKKAEEAATRAETAAGTAETARQLAVEAKDSLKAEIDKLEKDRHDRKVQAWIGTGTLAVLLVQGIIIWGQLHQAETSSKFVILQQLRQETLQIDKILFSRSGALNKYLARPCGLELNLDDNEDKVHFKDFLGHFELYFDALQLDLITPAQWSTACIGLKKVREKYCHIDTAVNLLLKESSETFRIAIDTCSKKIS